MVEYPRVFRHVGFFRLRWRRTIAAGTANHEEVRTVTMLELRRIEQDILASGKVDSHHLEALRRLVYAGGKIGRPEADSLAELHKRVQHRSPAFERFFYQALKDHLLADGRLDAEQAAWLRRLLYADGTRHDEARKLLHELKGEAAQLSRPSRRCSRRA